MYSIRFEWLEIGWNRGVDNGCIFMIKMHGLSGNQFFILFFFAGISYWNRIARVLYWNLFHENEILLLYYGSLFVISSHILSKE